MTQTQFALLFLAVLVSLPAVAQADLQLQDYDAKRHDRFYTGGDKAFIGAAYDWSGVGKVTTSAEGGTESRWAVMISPSYFLTSAHFRPGAGDTLTFYEGNDPAGPSPAYTIAAGGHITTYGNMNSDLWLGHLTSAVPEADHIAYYPVLSLPAHDDYLSLEIYVYGRPDRVGRNNIDDFALVDTTLDGNTHRTAAIEYDFDNPGGVGGDEAKLVGGDSGAPGFVVRDGELALVGIHVGVLDDVSYDAFVPYYIDQLNANMSGGESITPAPEPASLALWAAMLPAGLALLRRRRGAA